jgi:hypothetical protein
MKRERSSQVRRVLWALAMLVWIAGVALVVLGERATGLALVSLGGLALFTLLVTRLDDPDAQPQHTPPI